MIEPSRLLAGRPGLSRVEKDAMLEAVLAEVAPSRRWAWPALGATALAALAALVFVLRPAPPAPDELTARGGSALAAGFALSCVPAPCRAGATLTFEITATGGAAYFSAFARNDAAWIWYFPATAAAHSVALPADGGVLDLGIALGPEHAPGRYTVVGVFSDQPLDRAAVRARAERGDSLVTRDLVIQ